MDTPHLETISVAGLGDKQHFVKLSENNISNGISDKQKYYLDVSY
jgi:hypothetical protein